MDAARGAAAEWELIRSVMREVEQDPNWPAGLGDCELQLHPDGSTRWAFADVVYALDGDVLAELVVEPTVQARLINVRTHTVTRVTTGAHVAWPSLN